MSCQRGQNSPKPLCAKPQPTTKQMTPSCQEKHNNGWHPALRRPRQGMKNQNEQDATPAHPMPAASHSTMRQPPHTIATAASATISLHLPHAMAS